MTALMRSSNWLARICGTDRDVDCGSRLSDELFRARLCAWQGRRLDRKPFVLALLGWVAVMLSGGDSSGNALFGNLQVIAARQLDLSPVLFAATNSSCGVVAKMISPQNIATGVSVTTSQTR